MLGFVPQPNQQNWKFFMELNIINFIKYCLGYIKLTRQRTFALQQKYSANLTTEHVIINFGYFEIEIPVVAEEDILEIENEDIEVRKTIPKSLFDETVTNEESTT